MVSAYGLKFDSLELNWDDPIYLSYAADKERAEYFADQGYDLELDLNFGVSFKTEKVGILGLVFANEFGIVPISAYKSQPTIVRTFHDIVELRYSPFPELEILDVFYAYSSRTAYRRVTLINPSNHPVAVHILALFQRLPFMRVKAEEISHGFTFSLDILPDRWQKSKLDRYQGKFQASFASVGLEQRAVYDGIWQLQARCEGECVFTSSARRGSLLVLGEQLALAPQSEQTIHLTWHKKDRNRTPVGREPDLLSGIDIDAVFKSRAASYSRALSSLHLPDRDHALLAFSAILLLRAQYLKAENRLPYEYYLFSREPTWGWGHAGQVFHESIGTIAYAHLDPQGAMDSQRNYFAMQDKDGYIPYRIGPYLRETIDGETSSAPLLNWEAWKIYQITHDRSFLKEAYEHGARFYEWWKLHRDKDKDGLCEWGGNPILECVRDSHNVIFQEVLGGNRKRICSLEAFDLNCFLVSEAEALSSMAKELGLENDAVKWNKEAEARKSLINQTFWDPKTSFYYHADLATNKILPELKRKEMIAFLALWAHVASAEQARLLVNQLTNPKLFWRKFGIPGLAANDPYYDPNTGDCKWNGPVWPQWQYLIFEGLLDYGYTDIARALLGKVSEAITYWLTKTHKFWEQYDPDRITEQKSHHDYYWTGIIFEMLWNIYHKDNG